MTNKQRENSVAIGVRFPKTTYEEIKVRAAQRGITVNQWFNWAITQGLRKHKKLNKSSTLKTE